MAVTLQTLPVGGGLGLLERSGRRDSTAGDGESGKVHMYSWLMLRGSFESEAGDGSAARETPVRGHRIEGFASFLRDTDAHDLVSAVLFGAVWPSFSGCCLARGHSSPSVCLDSVD